MRTRIQRMVLAVSIAVAVASCSRTSPQTTPPPPQPSSPAEHSPQLSDINQVVGALPDDPSWLQLAPSTRAQLEAFAEVQLRRDRAEWGLSGLQTKEEALVTRPTPAMLENFDRVLSHTFASELPDGFRLSRDVQNARLRRLLARIYLREVDARSFMLLNHPTFRAWDGEVVQEHQLLDEQHVQAMAHFMAATEAGLRALGDAELSPIERRLRDKSYFLTRGAKHDRLPPVGTSGSFGFASLYALPKARLFADDAAVLNAYNSSMFAELGEVNVGTIQAFLWDFGQEFNEPWLTGRGMSVELARKVLRLGALYKSRVLALPDAKRRCTVYSPEERASNWDSFTAAMISNSDGSETIESYSSTYQRIAAQRTAEIRALAQSAFEALFPVKSQSLSAAERNAVVTGLSRETRPAAVLDTLKSLLDSTSREHGASNQLNAALSAQESVGGYEPPETLVREEDRRIVNDYWRKMRLFLAREYGGYALDIASLMGNEPVLSTSDETAFTIGGVVSLGIKNRWVAASLASTMLHEAKHAIDQNSHGAVEGAAWEGAATSVERQVWPLLLGEFVNSGEVGVSVASLLTAIDNVRFTATTEATLRTFLRGDCDASTPDAFEYARQIVAGYGYGDPKVLDLRAKRANASTQYLQYDYGLVMYQDLLAFLQTEIGATPRVDAFLLQACGMPSPKKEASTVERLKACIAARKRR